MYFSPSGTPGEVVAESWVTAEAADLDRALTEVVLNWLVDAWPFPIVRYRLGARSVTLGSDGYERAVSLSAAPSGEV